MSEAEREALRALAARWDAMARDREAIAPTYSHEAANLLAIGILRENAQALRAALSPEPEPDVCLYPGCGMDAVHRDKRVRADICPTCGGTVLAPESLMGHVRTAHSDRILPNGDYMDALSPGPEPVAERGRASVLPEGVVALPIEGLEGRARAVFVTRSIAGYESLIADLFVALRAALGEKP
jgi:hypothetical protein